MSTKHRARASITNYALITLTILKCPVVPIKHFYVCPSKCLLTYRYCQPFDFSVPIVAHRSILTNSHFIFHTKLRLVRFREARRTEKNGAER